MKSGIAATAAWMLAEVVLQAPSATFAPFSALLMVQVTVAQSVDQSLRYGAAVVGGVLLAGLVTPLLGPGVTTFAVLMLMALLIGRWHKLGSQGSQVAVAALFAYASFVQSGGGSSSILQVASIGGLVIMGCVVGVLTNLVVVPPVRYRSAQYAVAALSRSLRDLLTDIDDGVRQGVPDKQTAESWLHRADQLGDTVAQARSSVEHAADSMRLNPRRLLMRGTRSFTGYRVIVDGLERASEQVRSLARGLQYMTVSDQHLDEEHDTTHSCATTPP